MKYCPNCGTALEDIAAFCTNCGVPQGQPAAPVAPAAPAEATQVATAPAEAAPVYAAPVYAQPVYQQPYQPTPLQEPSVGTKVLGYIGFGLSILGTLFSLITISAAAEEAAAGFVLSLFLAAFSIVGLCFCSSARKGGFKNGLTMTGKIFGIISVVLFGLAAIVSLAGM